MCSLSNFDPILLFISMEKIMLLDAVKKMMDLVEIQDSRDPKKVCYPLGPTLFAISGVISLKF